MMALEIAIDEMAEKLGMDPVEFRIINDTQVVPDNPPRPPSNDPQATKQAAGRPAADTAILATATHRMSPHRARSDLAGRSAMPAPGGRREGRWLIGMGVAAAFRNNQLTKSAASRAAWIAAASLTVETDMTDIGTGSYTIIGQTAAEMMGLPIDKVVVRLGDSAFPVSAGSGGQWGGNCSTAGVYAACVKLRETVAQRLGINPAEAVFADGKVSSAGRSVSLADVAARRQHRRRGRDRFRKCGKLAQQSTFGAHFVEVGVDAATGETRIRRMLAACACGRILNPKTARSQVIGAMTMGVGRGSDGRASRR